MDKTAVKRYVLIAWGGFAFLHLFYLSANWSSYYSPEVYVLYGFIIHVFIGVAVLVLFRLSGRIAEQATPLIEKRVAKKERKVWVSQMMHGDKPLEIYFNVESCVLKIGINYPIQSRNSFLGTYAFEADPHTRVFAFHLPQGKLYTAYNNWEGEENAYSILHLSPLETVNYHQWHGKEPDWYEDNTKTRITETARWEIASVDTSQGSRVTMLSTHAPKNKVFEVQMRLGQVLTYAQSILAPFAPLLEAGETIPEDELREIMEENPPKFGWA